MLSGLAQRLARLLFLLLGVNALLFVALGLAGDPALILAGEEATPELLERIRTEYGLNLPAWQRYLVQLGRMVQLDFGVSLYTGQPALAMALEQLPGTLLMAVLSMALTLITAIPAGAWIGQRPEAASRRFGAALTAVAQGIPGFVMALVLIQIFVVHLGWLPSLGYGQPAAWILPSVSLGFFLAPKLCRVVSAGVAEAMQQDYIRTARANGASMRFILWREALPAAMPAAVALIGAQFAFLVSGVVLIESLFLWPGIGLLLLRSAQTLDFPVLQAICFVVAALVFAVNSLADALLRLVDARLRPATQ
ncbi:ABC transporter permease [Candidatus Foliamicus sp.]